MKTNMHHGASPAIFRLAKEQRLCPTKRVKTATHQEFFGFSLFKPKNIIMNADNILEGNMDPDTITNLRREIGADSDEQTEAAISAITTTLMSGLSKNAESQNGAESLLSALDRDHDGSI